MKTSIPWVRVFIEGVVIVGSILLAFGIDAWWEGRQERELELEYAGRLKADLTRDTLRMRQGIFQVEEKMSVLNDLVADDALSRLLTDPEDTMSRLRLSTFHGMNELTDGAFRELEGSGRLVLLEDPVLRDALSAYYAVYDVVLRGIAASFGPYRQVMSATVPSTLFDTYGRDGSVDMALLESGLRALLGRPDLSDAVNSELVYETERLRWHRFIRNRATRLLDTLAAAYPGR